MVNKKAMLAVSSLLALTAGMSGPASASLTIPTPDVKTDRVGQTRAVMPTDPLFEFSLRSGDMQSPEKVESALLNMFDNPSREQVEGLPAFLASISSLGLTPDILRLSKEVLIGIAASASDVDETVRQDIVSELRTTTKPIKVAQKRRPLCYGPRGQALYDEEACERIRPRHREPELGQVGGGGYR